MVTFTGSMDLSLKRHAHGGTVVDRGHQQLRVLLLDHDQTSNLYVADGLTRAGCQVHILSSSQHLRPPYRRRRIAHTTAPEVNTSEYQSLIRRIITSESVDVILPVSEGVLYYTWQENPEWSSNVFPQVADWQQELLRSKYVMSRFVAEHGVRIPPTAPAQTQHEIDAALAEFGFPVVVKAVRGHSGKNVRFCHARTEVESALHELNEQSGGAAFLQKYIDGPTFLAGGVFQDGEGIRWYATQMMKTDPPKVGPSILHRTTADPELLGAMQTVFRAFKWTGLAECDFVQDAEGHFYFLEVNPRSWGSISAAARAGVDLFSALAAMLRGDDPDRDTRFGVGVDAAVFPEYAMAHLREHGLGIPSCARLVFDKANWNSIPWTRPGLLAHLLYWLFWRNRARREIG